MLSLAPGHSATWAHTLAFSLDASAARIPIDVGGHAAAAGPAAVLSGARVFTLGSVGGALLIAFVGSFGCLWARAQTRGFAAKQIEADRVYVKLAA
jgi:hypothetical protein